MYRVLHYPFFVFVLIGEFVTQTCFQGRFGEETGSDQFGSQIIIHAPRKDEGLVEAHIENTEVTYAGQAFRLGRYAIHFHINGDMQGSYVRGSSIHQSFNRAINVHATHHLTLEHNVAHNIMGGAFFTEDGIETGNIFQYNLAVFVKSSTSLQNDDVTPAAFWVTNPNNTVRLNHVAGGTHFGFWYRMHEHPDGPSFDPNICPQKVPLGEFTNNTVHSQGWFGVWIFEVFYPTVDGACEGTTPVPADFNGLISWNNEKGAETVGGGAIQFTDFMFVNNEVAGYDFKLGDNVPKAFEYTDDGPLLARGVIAADGGGVLEDQDSDLGIKLPYGPGFKVSSVTFVNFDESEAAAFGGTKVDGTTEENNGGFTYQVEGLEFVNSPNKAFFRWLHDFGLHDLDGTLTGIAGGKVVPDDEANPDSCAVPGSGAFSANSEFPGAVCPADVKFHRFSWNNALPTSLEFKDAKFSNDFGATEARFQSKRSTHVNGWHVLLVDGQTYFFEYVNAEQITNISYTGRFYDFEVGDTPHHNLNVYAVH